MIRTMWNTLFPGTPTPAARPTEYYILQLGALERIITDRLPLTWTVELKDKERRGGPDAILWIRAPDGDSVSVVVETKTSLQPRDVPYIADQLARYSSGPKLLVAPFLAVRTQEALIDRDISYADMTGNIRLALDSPAVFIRERGLESDPWRERRALRSLKGPTAGRVIRALCDFWPPYGVRELAQKSGTAPASVSRVLTFLEPEGLVTRERSGQVTGVDWADLIRRWTQDYSLMKSNTTYMLLEPRGLKALLDKFGRPTGDRQKYAITGSLAASEVAAYAPARLATLYAENAKDLAEAFELRPAESGANVLIAEPFDPVVFDRTWQRKSLVFSALSQVAADLLTSPGRAPSEGEELIRWMQENEDEWRS